MTAQTNNTGIKNHLMAETSQESKLSFNTLRPNFWQYPLNELSHDEWEALCDGCGVCCLVKFLDEPEYPESVEYTSVACKLLDCSTGRCSNYANRQNYVPDCISLTMDMLPEMMWLPNSCAYKRLYQGRSLPDWHHLVTGDKQQSAELMKQQAISVAGKCVPEVGVTDEELEDRIIKWVIVS